MKKTESLKALIIEDEKLIARDLANKITEIDPGIQIIEILSSLKSARKWFLTNEEPDLIFMDIHLNDGLSFDIFKSFTIKCPVIFTTAYDKYAIRAFKLNGIDYLLKPVSEEELSVAIEKARKMKAINSIIFNDHIALAFDYINPIISAKKYKEKFIVNYRNQWIPLNVSDIALFTRDNVNYIITRNGKTYTSDNSTLEDIEELINPNDFFRANRQCIIHINSINSIRPTDNQKLIVQLKDPLAHLQVDISREKAPAFKKWLNR
jgi:DNA-binding LytR/AlgR family response regulator